jgi:hypothetical protein
MFPSAIIKKDKKKLVGVDKVPATKLEGANKVPESEVPKTKAVAASPVPKANSPKSEDVMSINLMLNGAKKKPKVEAMEEDVNAATSQGEYFKVEKGENPEEKEKYLKAIGKLKKK